MKPLFPGVAAVLQALANTAPIAALVPALVLAAIPALIPAAVQAQGGAAVYRCPGPPVLYTDALSAEEARERGCRTIEGAPITIIQAPRPRPAAPAAVPGNAAPRASEARVDNGTQRQRDSDARRILEAELKREEERLEALKREFNNGEPERRAEERNFQKYQERVAELRAAIGRSERDMTAIRREIAKLPP